MAKKFKVFDTESGRIVSIIERVADAVSLASASCSSGAAVVTVTSTTGLWPGMLLVGNGITAGTTVLSVDSATVFTMSANATAAISNQIILARSYIPYKADGTLEVREVHLEHYRDLFNDKTYMDINGALPGGGTGNGGHISAAGVLVYPADPVFEAFSGGTLGNVSVSGTATLVLSDDKSHTAPREQTQKCSFVHFILDDGTLLPVLRLPSYDIVPSL